jgi:hypothetical protein
MILRRIIAHFRKQEWTAIGIDFVIVVVGVFVGIQVANWNAGQADARRGAHYVERLSRDLEEDLVARRGEVAYYGAVLNSVVRANALLADPRSDPEALVVSAYRATEVTYRPPTRSTWDEIVSSGDIGLLSRQAVDSGIADYYASDTSLLMLDSLNNSGYRRAVRQIIPLEVQMAIRAGCSDVRDEAQQIVGFMEQCVLDVDDAVLGRTASALRADAGVRAALQYQYSHAFTARANLSGDVVYLERALAALRGEPVR